MLVGKMGGTSGEEGRGQVCKKEAALVGKEEGQREERRKEGASRENERGKWGGGEGASM